MYDFGEPLSGNGFAVERNFVIGLIPALLAIVGLIIHIAFAIGVFKDASARRDSSLNLWFVSPIFWGGATLIGSVFVAGVYWAMHYSSLVGTEPRGDEPRTDI